MAEARGALADGAGQAAIREELAGLRAEVSRLADAQERMSEGAGAGEEHDELIEDEARIEAVILENTEDEVDFYPEEIALRFGLDPGATMAVMAGLEERGLVVAGQ